MGLSLTLWSHTMSRLILLVTLVIFLLSSGSAQADTFGSGENLFEIEFVSIGNPGNRADFTGSPSPAGSVAYEYNLAKYEISEGMIDKANAQSVLDGTPLGITHGGRGPNKPATSVDLV